MHSRLPSHLRTNTKKKSRAILKIILLIFGVLAIFAFIADRSKSMKANRSQSVKSPDDEIQGIILSENRPVFKDVKGMFSIAPPRGWGISTYPNSSPYNVTFQSPNGPSISVTATKVEYNSLATLLDRVEGIQDNLGLNMNIEEIKFTDVPAIRRTTVLHHAKVITIDFVDNYIGHNIQISIPHSLYERFSPVLLDVVSSYKPLK